MGITVERNAHAQPWRPRLEDAARTVIGWWTPCCYHYCLLLCLLPLVRSIIKRRTRLSGCLSINIAEDHPRQATFWRVMTEYGAPRKGPSESRRKGAFILGLNFEVDLREQVFQLTDGLQTGQITTFPRCIRYI